VGLALVPQHDLLVEAASVADNLALLDPRAPLVEGPRARRARVGRLAAQLALDLGSPDARVAGLPVGTRQRIEVAGALLSDPAVLILDEPTAVLSPDETAALFGALRQRASTGRAIVVITHRLAEVFEWGDRVTLLARGRTILESPVAETSRETVAALLLGNAQGAGREAPARGARRAGREGPLLCLDAFGPSGAPPVSLDVPAGSLLTLLAIDGNGADEIAAAIAGLAPSSGTLEVAGVRLPSSDPRAFRAAGGAYVPGDRRREGLVASFTLAENLALRRAGGLRLERAAARRFASVQIEAFGIRAPGPDALAGQLSGGNQQKLVLARELADAPRLLLAVHPTRGLDLAASAEIRARLVGVTLAGGAALVVTADPDEAAELGGPIRVVHRGRLSEPFPPTTPFEVLGRLMGGLAA